MSHVQTLVLFLQTAKPIEALKGLESLLVTLGVAVGAGIGAYAAVQGWTKKIRENLHSLRQASQQLTTSSEQLTNSKEEIVNASQRNYREIRTNTEITEDLNEKLTNYVDTVQRHILSRVQEELGGVNQQLVDLNKRLEQISLEQSEDETHNN